MPIIEVSTQDLFSGRRFVIPNYQRHYAWSVKECQAMLDDLNMIDVNNQHHTRFMGYITTISVDSNPLKTTKMEALYERQIVDGQQRMISLSLLISAIIRGLSATGDPKDARLAEDLKEKYLITDDVTGHINTPRLLIQELPAAVLPQNQSGLMRPLYLSLIDNFYAPPVLSITIPAMTRMREVAKFFDDYVGGLDRISLHELIFKINSKLFFGLNEARNFAHAGDMFEGLNNRGKPLSDLERIKSHAVYSATSLLMPNVNYNIGGNSFSQNSLIDYFNEKIGDIYYALDRMDLGENSYEIDLIIAHYPLIRSRILSAVSIAREQPSNFFRDSLNLTTAITGGQAASNLLLENAHAYLELLAEVAPYYADIRRPSDPNGFGQWSTKPSIKSIRYYSESIRGLGKSKHYAPILIACRAAYPRDMPGYCKLLRALETLAFWSVALGKGEYGQSAVNNKAEDIYRGNLKIDDFIREINKRVANNILKKADKNIDADDLEYLIAERGIENICQAIKKIISGDDVENVFGYIIFEYWENKKRGIFVSRESVVKSIKSKEYFNRVFPPRKGQSIQQALSGSNSGDRGTWSRHVSNIVPAINVAQKNLSSVSQNQDYISLSNVGVDPVLLGSALSPQVMDKLCDDFNAFVAKRWCPDLNLSLNCNDRFSGCSD